MTKRWLAGLVCALALASTSSARDARAFCGFYVSGADTRLTNNATQVVLMRDGTRTVLSMQNNYQGPPQDFAMVVPVPVVLDKDKVKTLDRAMFDEIDQLDAPRLVEYWEQDPCHPFEEMERMSVRTLALGSVQEDSGGKRDLGVKVEAKFAVGEYDVVILSAKDSGGLETWLLQEKYKIPAGSEPCVWRLERHSWHRGARGHVTGSEGRRAREISFWGASSSVQRRRTAHRPHPEPRATG